MFSQSYFTYQWFCQVQDIKKYLLSTVYDCQSVIWQYVWDVTIYQRYVKRYMVVFYLYHTLSMILNFKQTLILCHSEICKSCINIQTHLNSSLVIIPGWNDDVLFWGLFWCSGGLVGWFWSFLIGIPQRTPSNVDAFHYSTSKRQSINQTLAR